MTPRMGPGDERRRPAEVVQHHEPDPRVDVLEDEGAVYVPAEFPAEVEVAVEATRVVFKGPGAPRGLLVVDLPAPVDVLRATSVSRNGVVDVVAPKLTRPA